MSSYFLGVVPNHATDKVLTLFYDKEVRLLSQTDTHSTVLVSNSANISPDGSAFIGHAIDRANRKVVFPGAPDHELPSYDAPVEGCYLRVQFRDAGLGIGSDLLGWTLKFWSSDESFAAVSDSFHTIVAVRKALNLPCTTDQKVVASRQWTYTMGNQLLSNRTFIKQISYALPGSFLRVRLSHLSRRKSRVETTVISRSFRDIAALPVASYKDQLRTAAIELVSLLKTYASLEGRTNLALSGGFDSRVCLAALKSGNYLEEVNLVSNQRMEADFKVAAALADYLGLKLNSHPQVNSQVTRIDEVATWTALSSGIYDPLHVSASQSTFEVPMFSIGGHGGETVRGMYGWRKLQNVPMPKPALKQAIKGNAAAGIAKNDPMGSEWHYFGYRNPIHGSRQIATDEYIVRPLAIPELIGLAHSDLNQLPSPTKYGPSILSDLLIILAPDLARFPFDSNSKALSESFVEERLLTLGGTVKSSQIEPLAVVGRAKPSIGTTKSLVRIAAERGLTGRMSGKNLAAMIDGLVRRHSAILGSRTLSLIQDLDLKSDSKLTPSSPSSLAVGKLLALSVL